MSKYGLVGMFFYREDMPFEVISSKEAQLVELLEEKLYEVDGVSFSTESEEQSLRIRCDFPNVLPLHFLRDTIDSLCVLLGKEIDAKFLLFSIDLSVVSVGMVEEGRCRFKNMDSINMLEYKKSPIYTEASACVVETKK